MAGLVPLPKWGVPCSAENSLSLGSRDPGGAGGSCSWQQLCAQEWKHGFPSAPPWGRGADMESREIQPGRDGPGDRGWVAQARMGAGLPAGYSCDFLSFLLSHCNRKDKHPFALPTSAMGQKGKIPGVQVPRLETQCPALEQDKGGCETRCSGGALRAE